MLQYTVILMPDGAAAVRRFRIRVSSPRRLAGIALAVVLTLAAVTADWVRLRLEGVDGTRLRAQATAQREQLQVYAEQLRVYSEKVGEVEAQLALVREFERKVRVIANLPTGAAEPRSNVTAPLLGVGGGADDPAHATPPIGAPTGANAKSREQAPAPAAAGEGVAAAAPASDPVPWERIRARAEALAERALQQQGSLQSLIEQIRDKADQLASTPSIWPAHGWLTSLYGYRISPFTGLRDFHAGIDISAEPGTEIVAPARGRVAFAGPMGALGNAVVLDHGQGIRTTFGHAKALLVQPGQSVERGQRIALVGSSGRSTGPHVHYAVERNGRLTNPIDYIVE